MAYQRKPNEQEDAQVPKAGLLGGYLSPSPAAEMAANAPPKATNAPSGSGYVNFDRIYSANEDVAKRDAGRMSQSVTGAVNKAQTNLGGLKQQFTSQSVAAQGQGPSAAQKSWATNATTGVKPGKTVMAATYGMTPAQFEAANIPGYKNPNSIETVRENGRVRAENAAAGVNAPHTGATVTEHGEGLDSGGYWEGDPKAGGKWISTVDVKDDSGNVTIPAAADPAELERQVRAAADGEYAGPGSIVDLEGFGGLLKDYGAAQDSLYGIRDNASLEAALKKNATGPHIEGGSRLDAALMGQAGRPEFADLSARYKDVGNEVGGAVRETLAQGKDFRSAAEANAGEYQKLLDDYLRRQGRDQEAEDLKQKRSDAVVDRAKQRGANQTAYEKAVAESHSGINAIRNGAHDVAAMLSPSSWVFGALGERTPLEAGTQYFGEQYGGDKNDGFNAGNMSDAWGSDDADVFASMSPEDWASFNQMKISDQKAFIAQRKAELRGGGK